MSQKCKFCFLLYRKEIYAQFVETNVLVKHDIYHELKPTIMDLDWQITWKHPVVSLSQATCDLWIFFLSMSAILYLGDDRTVKRRLCGCLVPGPHCER